MGTAVEVEGLRKSYGDFEALRGVSFRVGVGESVALLGPNGAGKTTTVEILEGYRKPTSGSVSVLGLDPSSGGVALRKRIGIVLQEAGFPPDLTVVELVEAWRRFYPSPMATEEILGAVGLGHRRDVRTKNLSGGEHRRLDLALGLVGRPELLFLDEPTTGFDPSARRLAWELIDGLVGQGMTLLLTTHYLDEAQRLADRIIIVTEGRIVADGAPDEIGRREGHEGRVVFSLPDGLGVSDLPALPADTTVEMLDRTVSIRSDHLMLASHAVTGWAIERRIDLADFRVTRPSLEEVYLNIVGSEQAS